MTDILNIIPLGRPPWPTLDPFLFCVHHLDNYPAANPDMSPKSSLQGRNIGSDFSQKDGWSMYHGSSVPGFPSHPHRGFETITLARKGFIDHSDSMGAKARFGQGDVQWMTAGKGVVHSEMFPLIEQEKPNPTELFQIWINLPKADKFVEPYFTMFWSHNIPAKSILDSHDRLTEIVAIAGIFEECIPPSPPPNSWAARTEADVAVWTITMEPLAQCTLPPALEETNRVLYFFEGENLSIETRTIASGHGIQLKGNAEVTITNGKKKTEILLLQGKPIGEPVVQHGPFVMNTTGEIRQAMMDYQQTQFGGWPWGRRDPTHGHDSKRFALHADGKMETAG